MFRIVAMFVIVARSQFVRTFITLVHTQFNSVLVDAVGLLNRLRFVQAGNRDSIPDLGNTFTLTCGLDNRGIMV